MNTWFRKEDWWIPVIALIVIITGLLFWLAGAAINTSVDSRRADHLSCEMKGGEYLYLKYGGYKCLKVVK